MTLFKFLNFARSWNENPIAVLFPILKILLPQQDAMKVYTCIKSSLISDYITALIYDIFIKIFISFCISLLFAGCCAICWCVYLFQNVFLNSVLGIFSISVAANWLKIDRNQKLKKKELFQRLIDTSEDAEAKEMVDMSIFNLNYNDFQIIQELASGMSGALAMEAMDKKTKEKVFIKLFSQKASDSSLDYSEFKNEINHLTRLR